MSAEHNPTSATHYWAENTANRIMHVPVVDTPRLVSIQRTSRPLAHHVESRGRQESAATVYGHVVDEKEDGNGSVEKDLHQPSSDAGNDDGDVEKQSLASDGSSDNDNSEEEKDPNLVEWNGPDDPENPMNWKSARKWALTALVGITTFAVTFASSVFSTGADQTSREFGVSTEVMTLGTALFVLGFAFGPLVWSPLSELYGRKIPLLIGYAIFAIFQIPVAVAQNLQTIFVCRFFGGLAAAAPLGIVGGLLADMFEPVTRGLAVCVFSAATFIGPVAGPIAGGFITESYLGWRWTAWITLIMAAFLGVLDFIFLPETYAQTILQRRAKKMRFQTKNWALHAKIDETEVNLKSLVETYFLRPFKMLVLEPILLLVTLYMGFIYGILYLFFEVYPIAFQEQRGWSLGVGALPFLGILVGVLVGVCIITVTTLGRFKRVTEKEGHVVPEERLIPMIIGGAFLPIGLFWFAWTSSPNITPWPQIIAGIPIGAGIQMIFLQGLNYIIDCYAMNANSAIAANTFFRSWLGAGFPMFAMAMYKNLGVPWATSLLGFLAVALFPVPVVFYIYGSKIRKLSKYSPS